jgi:hypothetical protein
MSDAADSLDPFESLQRYVGEPLISPRLTVRRAGRQFVADADVRFRGRVLAAHASGPTEGAAVEAVVERLRRQLRRTVMTEVALRNEPRMIQAEIDAMRREAELHPEPSRKPPERRKIIRRTTYVSVPLSTIEAIRELLDLDLEFFLFRHVRTGEDVVVHRRDAGRLGLIFPAGSVLDDEEDLVIPEPDRHGHPISLAQAVEEMDLAAHRFVYFVDAADDRGKVLYLRHDSDYGLVAAT